MATKIIFFTGAPDANSLNWDEECLNKEAQSSPIREIESSRSRLPQFKGANDEDEAQIPVQWRVLPLEPARLRTGMTQSFETPVRNGPFGYSIGGMDASFFTTTSFSIERDKSEAEVGSEVSSSAESEILSQFYGHSLAVHEELPSSVISLSQSTGEDSFVESPVVGHNAGLVNAATSGAIEARRPSATNLVLADLNDIPNASYLRSIEPQTKTVNFIVGIISIPAPRTVKLRKWGKEMEIIEMIVGDETKAGFGITFWLPPSQELHSHPGEESSMRRKLQKLRPQDIVLLQHVALSSFKGQVHGQSLRRNMTNVELLYRRKVDRYDDGGVYSSKDFIGASANDVQLGKAKRAREWVLNFVGGTSVLRDTHEVRPTRGIDGGKRRRSPLPPDTQ